MQVRLRVGVCRGRRVADGRAGLSAVRARPRACAWRASAHGSIAVLPFTNLSGDAAKDYFSDGMSEELLNLLARVPGLQVASRTSAFAYKGRNVDIREVGQRARRRNRARRQRAPGRRPGADHGAADRHRDRFSPLVGNLRPPARGHLPGAGRDRRGDRRASCASSSRRRTSSSRSARVRPRRTSKPTSSTCRAARSGRSAARKT